jgi:hypothetical protein
MSDGELTSVEEKLKRTCSSSFFPPIPRSIWTVNYNRTGTTLFKATSEWERIQELTKHKTFHAVPHNKLAWSWCIPLTCSRPSSAATYMTHFTLWRNTDLTPDVWNDHGKWPSSGFVTLKWLTSRDTSFGIALGYGLDDRGSRVRFPAGAGNFFFTIVSSMALGSTHPPIQWVPEALSLRVKRPVCEADRSPPPSAEVKNAWSYTSTPPIRYGVVSS